MPTIVNGKVVQTTEIDLATYIQRKRGELEMLGSQISMLKTRQEDVITELESLIPQEA
jgi:hypothetical protein